MTDEEIHAVLGELRRVGVDLGRPPGLELGTGFRPGELLIWLRTLPDDLGHDAFVERMNAHVSAAAPVPAAHDREGGARDTRRSVRMMPTVEQLEAAVDILQNEWDPIGARLGDLSGEDVGNHAFNALHVILAYGHLPNAESRVARFLGEMEEEAFGIRRSPVVQRRYLARRLMQVVAEHPLPPGAQDLWEAIREAEGATQSDGRAGGRGRTGMSRATAPPRKVYLGPRRDEPRALDREAACSQCGATGTVAFVMREVEPRLSRYCADCWRKVRHKHWWFQPKWDKESPADAIAAFEYMSERIRERQICAGSALWEDRLEFVRAALASTGDRVSEVKRERDARRLARELTRRASEMDGPMPPEIEAFVRQHTSPGPHG